MEQRRVRLGDTVDDYCSRCRLTMNHGVMALADENILKVRCNTCMYEHPYRHGKLPKRKDPLKAAFDEVLGKIAKPPTPGK
ncbi:MAG TPA: hypothetical protein VFG76_10990 [Candidatus Polarisedimenticolia bacterium]|nr:hypothetical protein [Candidatus Polarisedimenticolia bacterium]